LVPARGLPRLFPASPAGLVVAPGDKPAAARPAESRWNDLDKSRTGIPEQFADLTSSVLCLWHRTSGVLCVNTEQLLFCTRGAELRCWPHGQRAPVCAGRGDHCQCCDVQGDNAQKTLLDSTVGSVLRLRTAHWTAEWLLGPILARPWVNRSRGLGPWSSARRWIGRFHRARPPACQVTSHLVLRPAGRWFPCGAAAGRSDVFCHPEQGAEKEGAIGVEPIASRPLPWWAGGRCASPATPVYFRCQLVCYTDQLPGRLEPEQATWSSFSSQQNGGLGTSTSHLRAFARRLC
jgi:hypothetical protein